MRPSLQDRVPCAALLCALAIGLAPASLCAQNQPAQNQPAQNQQNLRPWERVTPAPGTAAAPGPAAPGAATLPATPPTSQPTPANALPAPLAATPTSQTPAHRAEVSYSGGLLDVRANNSSLHQILRAISRRTGMTISGNIADDRVFGNYGPATPSSVLATLIDGTGVNMLLRDGDATHPMDLVLTPQTGSPRSAISATPIAADADDLPAEPARPAPPTQPTQAFRRPTAQPATPTAGANPPPTTSGAENQITTPPSIPQPLNNVNGSSANTSPTASTFPTTHSVPIDTLPTPSTTPSSSGIVDAPNPPPPGSTTGTSPNGVKTPQQIYQELLQMQQKQPQPSAPSNPTTPPQ